MCVALIVGNMIGSGVFLLPASLAPFGLNSNTGWAFTVGGANALAIVFAQLSRAVPAAGGPYVYTRAAFGELTGFVAAWGSWVAVWAGNAAIATGSVSYLSELVPSIARVPGASALVTVIVVWLLTGVNCLGVRATGWVGSRKSILMCGSSPTVCRKKTSRCFRASWQSVLAADLASGSTSTVAETRPPGGTSIRTATPNARYSPSPRTPWRASSRTKLHRC